MVASTHIVDVTCVSGGKVRTLSVAVPDQFVSFHPMTRLEFFALMQHRARKQVGPVAELVWTARPDPSYTPPKPPKPEQLGLF
jgi:hypothetical protein